MKRVVVVGGGLGGLAVAARLAARGAHVSLLEQEERLGGKMNRLELGGFRFDTGPSLITMPAAFEELFADTGHRLEEHVQLEPLDPAAEYVYPDGTRFVHTTVLPRWLETVRLLEPGDVDGFLKLLSLGARIYQLSAATFLRRPVGAPPDRQVIRALRHMPLRYAWGNYARVVQAHLRSPYLIRLFNRFPTYVGSSPYHSPAMLLVIPYMEYAFGAWFVRGGLYRIIEALQEIAERLAVEISLGARVERITHAGGRVTGVDLAGNGTMAADVVIMNGDAATLPGLLGKSDPSDVPAPSKRSLSGLVTLAGFPRDLPELGHHTVYFSDDYPVEFRQLFQEGVFPDDPTVYVNAPSRSDRDLVPGAGEAVFIMANAPARSESWDESMSRKARAAVFRRLAASGFPAEPDEAVVMAEVTPKDLASRYSMPGGAIYGAVSHGWRGAFLRPANRQRPRGLYLAGGSGHPGGGTPTVVISSRITADMVEADELS